MKLLGVIAGGTAIFAGGFVYGAISNERATRARLKKAQPIINNILADFLHKANTEKMSRKEMKAYLNSELDFFKLMFDQDIRK